MSNSIERRTDVRSSIRLPKRNFLVATPTMMSHPFVSTAYSYAYSHAYKIHLSCPQWSVDPETLLVCIFICRVDINLDPIILD